MVKRFKYGFLLYIFQCVINTHYFSGEDECEVPPVPIPNTEVKLDIADNSWGSPPAKIGFRQIFLYQKSTQDGCFFVVFQNIKCRGDYWSPVIVLQKYDVGATIGRPQLYYKNMMYGRPWRL